MPDDLSVVSSQPLPDLSVVDSQPLPKPWLQRLTEPDVTTQNPYVRGASNFGAGVISGLASIPGAIRHPIDTAKGIWQSVSDAVDTYSDPAKRPTLEGALSVLPDALSYGAGNAVSGELTGAAVGGLKASSSLARQSIGASLHTPEGALTPGAQIAGEVGGGAAGAGLGHLTGNNYIAAGAAGAGYKIGPYLLDKIFPEPAEVADKRALAEMYQQKAEDLMRRGREQDALDRQSARQELLNAKAGKPVPLTQSPYYNQIQAAQTQAAEDAKPVPLKNSPNYNINKDNSLSGQSTPLAQSPNANINADKALTGQSVPLPQSPNANINTDRALSGQSTSLSDSPYLPRYKAAQADLEPVPLSKSPNAKINAAKADSLDEVYGPQAGGESGFSLQDIISRTKRLVVPGEEPSAADLKRAGDFTQAPTPRLRELAKFGDRLAQIELNRRLKNQ